MTPSFYGEPVDYSRSYKQYNDYEDEEFFIKDYQYENRKFEIGKEYQEVGFFTGETWYKVEEIDRENGKALMSEVWVDVDGSGTRPSKWHDLKVDEYGNEMAYSYYSKLIEDDVWIYA